jgi:hypothetical protein
LASGCITPELIAKKSARFLLTSVMMNRATVAATCRDAARAGVGQTQDRWSMNCGSGITFFTTFIERAVTNQATHIARNLLVVGLPGSVA